MKTRKIVLCHKRAPGDTLVLTGLVRDIALSHPGKFEIGVDTSAMDLWRHNPHVNHELHAQRKKNPAGIEYVKIQYGKGIRDQNYEPVHFLSYFHRDFEIQCKTKVPLQYPYPDLHLSDEERTVPLIDGRYWVVVSGGKSDFTAKVWHVRKLQRVVSELSEKGIGCVQVGGNDSGHWHPPLQNVVNLVGHTNLRDLARLIWHSEGVICGVTCLMHMAAALQKPCVVLAGGREAWWWEGYVRENPALQQAKHPLNVPHQFLHTIGLLDCCKQHGCWRNKVVPLRDDKSICLHPVMKPGQPIPLCMDMITPKHVMEAIMKYYENPDCAPIDASVKDDTEPEKPAAPPDVIEVTPQPEASKKRRLINLFDDDDPPPKTNGACKSQPTRTKAQASVKVPKGMTPQEFLSKANVRVNSGAKMEGRGPNHDATVVAHAPGAPHPAVVPQDPGIFDHEDIGGKFTVCVLLYGPEKLYDMHHRCLSSIVGTCPGDRIDLRVASNQLNKKSLAMVQGYVDQGIITKHYHHPNNDFKYPVMREMFHDKSHPINTKWVIWFDDDSIADRTPAWLNILAQAIIQHHRRDHAHMFGAPFVWTLQGGQKQWFEEAPWHKGKPWRLHNGKPSPNGNKIVFCTGGFWAITAEAIRNCDIPDRRLGHNGGDYTIGEQLYQGGYKMKSFNAKKQFVHTSSVKRRGITQSMPGTTPTPRQLQVH